MFDSSLTLLLRVKSVDCYITAGHFNWCYLSDTDEARRHTWTQVSTHLNHSSSTRLIGVCMERDREGRENGMRAPTPYSPNHIQQFEDDAVLEDCVEVFTRPLGSGKPCAMETDPCSAPSPPTPLYNYGHAPLA